MVEFDSASGVFSALFRQNVFEHVAVGTKHVNEVITKTNEFCGLGNEGGTSVHQFLSSFFDSENFSSIRMFGKELREYKYTEGFVEVFDSSYALPAVHHFRISRKG